MAWDETNFDDRLSNLKKTWETGEKIGLPSSEAEKVWGMLSLELEFSGKPLAELEGVAWFARQWMETKNPHYIDAAFLACRKVGIAPPPTLLVLMEDVATARFAGLERGGTGKRIRDDSIHAEALRIVCGLHLAGASVEVAASKAARYIADQKLGKTYKASTLERDYSSNFRCSSPSLEDVMREAMERASDEHRQTWARLVSDLPEADDDLRGNRRD
jgi:hypothetical protein